MDGETVNAFVWAADVDCGTPDGSESPGALWLIRVVEAAREAFEGFAEGDELSDVVHEIADGVVPIYTHERWLVFVDLAAYNEDVSEYGSEDTDLTAQAGVALYMIAERVVGRVAEQLELVS